MASERVSKTKTYPVMDWAALPKNVQESYSREIIRAMWSGETRPPKAGDWYLVEGPSVAAYCCLSVNGEGTSYPIARIVRIRLVETVVEVF